MKINKTWPAWTRKEKIKKKIHVMKIRFVNLGNHRRPRRRTQTHAVACRHTQTRRTKAKFTTFLCPPGNNKVPSTNKWSKIKSKRPFEVLDKVTDKSFCQMRRNGWIHRPDHPTDRLTDGPTDKSTDRPTNLINWQTDWLTDRPPNQSTKWPRDWPTNRPTNQPRVAPMRFNPENPVSTRA